MNRIERVSVGKVSQRAAKLVKQPWWMSCPCCPMSSGFFKFETHEEALARAILHVQHSHSGFFNVECA